MSNKIVNKFDCKSQHCKCKASCCSVVPFSNERWERNQKNIVTAPSKIFPGFGPSKVNENGDSYILEGDIIPVTETGKCCFLNTDLSCNIYADRPDICKKFGTESHLMMKCNFMDKNGRTRSRQENRKIVREQTKWTDSLANKFNPWKS